jgi:hypothetical protein
MFCKDSREEHFLTYIGADWEYVDRITFDDLIAGWEDDNIGRSQPRIEDAILEYGTKMEGGSPAPAPIIRKVGDAYRVPDGVQRLLAAQTIGATWFAAYVVECSQEMASVIRVISNQWLQGGHCESSQWTLSRAVSHLAIEMKMSDKEVARLGGWGVKTVEAERVQQQAAFTIRCYGGPADLTKGVVLAIADAVDLDHVAPAKASVAAFCDDLKRAKFVNEEAKPFIKAFFDGIATVPRGDIYRELTERLELFRDDREVSARLDGRPVCHRAPDAKLRSALRTVVTITDQLVLEKAEIAYVDEFFQLTNKIRNNIKQLRGGK